MPRTPKKKSAAVKKQKSTKSRAEPAQTSANVTLTATSVQLPKVSQLTVDAFNILKQHKALFFRLIVAFWAVSVLASGIEQQVQYQEVRDVAEVYSNELVADGWQKPFEIFALLIAIIGGAQNTTLSEMQVAFTVVTYLFLWLVVIWILRHLIAGTYVKLRDGLYNAGSAIFSTLMVGLIAMLQLLPLALVMALFSLLSVNGVLSGTVLISVAIVALVASVVASLYWLVGTFFAAVIVTIPGSYPVQSLRSAKKLVKGLRSGILLRLLWLGVLSTLAFAVGLLPFITFDHLLGLTESILVIAAIQLVSLTVFVYAVTYVYLLYRKIVDERG